MRLSKRFIQLNKHLHTHAMSSDHSLDDIMGSIAVGQVKISPSDFDSSDFDLSDTSRDFQKATKQSRELTTQSRDSQVHVSSFSDDIDAVLAKIPVPRPQTELKTIPLEEQPVLKPKPVLDMSDMSDISDLEGFMMGVELTRPETAGFGSVEATRDTQQASKPVSTSTTSQKPALSAPKPPFSASKAALKATSPQGLSLRAARAVSTQRSAERAIQAEKPVEKVEISAQKSAPPFSSSMVNPATLDDPFCDEQDIQLSPPHVTSVKHVTNATHVTLSSSPYFKPQPNPLNLPELPDFDFSSQKSHVTDSNHVTETNHVIDLSSDHVTADHVTAQTPTASRYFEEAVALTNAMLARGHKMGGHVTKSCDRKSQSRDTQHSQSRDSAARDRDSLLHYRSESVEAVGGAHGGSHGTASRDFSTCATESRDTAGGAARDALATPNRGMSGANASSPIIWEPSSRDLLGYDTHKLNLREKSELKVYGRLEDTRENRAKRLKRGHVSEGHVTESSDSHMTKNHMTKSLDHVTEPLQQLSSNKSNRPKVAAGKKKKIQSRLYTTSSNTLVDVDAEEDGLMTVEVASLSAEQQAIHDLVINGETNIFFTGAAGTGKSVLLRQIIASLRQKYKRQTDRVAVTASTGLAACNVQGTTLHSFAGCGLAREDVDQLCKRIRRNKKARDRWQKVNVLVIDEISMVDARFWDKLEAIARKLRRNQKPFGGIQVIVTGDFYQLPPVPDTHKDRFRGSYGAKQGNTGMVDSRTSAEIDPEARFAFEAESWGHVIDSTFLLTKVFRQKDPTFANMLNQLRTQSLDQSSLEGFMSLSRPLSVPDGIIPTELFPTRREVDRSNSSKLNTLGGGFRTFDALETGSAERDLRDKLLENLMVPKKLTLKAGAQVMMLKNMDPNLVNGSIGVVVGFMSPHNFVAAENAADLDNIQGKQRASIYDVTSEKDLDKLNRMVESGQMESSQAEESGYFSSPSDCVFERLTKFPEDEENATFLERKLARRKQLEDLSKSNLAALNGAVYPVVRFRRMDHTFRNVLLHPETFSVENIDGEVLASRTQIPLILAWALSIHKAQGQTLQYVKVDLAKTFERGQAYVALSRATSKEGLQVLNFLPEKVKTHPKVVEFYKTLTTYDDEEEVVVEERGQMRAVG